MRTASRFVVVILFLVLILGGIFGYKFYQIGQMKEQFSQPQPPAVVAATTAETMSWQPSQKSVGSITAINGVEVANEVPGTIVEIGFESGQNVKAGDMLVRLDSAVDESAVSTRRAEARLAAREFSRLEELLPRRAVSQAEYDQAQANLEAAQARVKEAEAQLGKKTLRAPFAGTLGLRQVDLGQYLPAGSPIVEINMLDPVYVDYTLPERELSRVSVGNTVEVTVAAQPDALFTGTVSAINSSVNPQTRTVRVRATLPNEDLTLRPGMFATVRTLRPAERDVIAVPRTAISYNTYGDFVFVLAENGDGQLVTERRSVQTGETRDGMVEIVSGLEAGDRIVETGLLRLRADQRVEIQTEKESQSGGQTESQGTGQSPQASGEAAS
ncbi:efflux RND transporter periplasmic adaptor subunit [Hydrocarboniclastica marina]|uniref:Efflux RND transporter periplasmic adaptor subunit n=1 Tax=Hydrocarboniclastica marina TaxID=2259620 RepID=A0A4P7XIY8_9ALTE|nr:efflux RND transporter periplasmic adaptor subunit [Hydrocarboniclastica marina]MAL97624.1 efflux transporter periplasmic adaptor subunit [Alteromonadaceae bacterium]QCF26713.1 efflux RND transporter periplasmic adaptor subunit [Hydrocarboniclastica marina]